MNDEFGERDDEIRNMTTELAQRILSGGEEDDLPVRVAMAAIGMGENLVEGVEAEEETARLISCEKGCSYCCHAQVKVTAFEAMLIGAWIAENFDAPMKEGLLSRIDENLTLTGGRSLAERVTVWECTPCIFLENHACTIYPVRPLICRAWHSTSREQCLAAFEAKDHRAEIDNTPYRNYILGMVRAGLGDALDQMGHVGAPVEITRALKIVLESPEPLAAWTKENLPDA